MQLSETHYVSIDGTEVSAAVNSSAEAKAAIKELKHKKKEYAHLKRSLVRARKKAEADVAPRKPKRRGKQSTIDQVRDFLGTVASAARALKRANAEQDLQLIERELKKTDQILHNIDAVLLQIEGKLLRHS